MANQLIRDVIMGGKRNNYVLPSDLSSYRGKKTIDTAELPYSQEFYNDWLENATTRHHFDPNLNYDEIEKYGVPIKRDVDIRQLLSDAQPWHTQAFNGIVGGTLRGLATAAEGFSYLFDWEGIANDLMDTEAVNSNWFADGMKAFKDKLIEEWTPIHRSDDNIWKWDQGAFIWDSLGSLLDSAIGFGIPGGALGKAGQALNITSKAAKLVGRLDKVTKAGKLTNRLATAQKIAQEIVTAGNAGVNLTAGFLTNFIEGQVMGVEMYENVLDQLMPKVNAGEIDIDDAMAIAADEADTFRLRNKIFMFTDAAQLSSLFKMTNFSRGLIKKGQVAGGWEAAKYAGKEFLLDGIREYGEETGQSVMQQEGEYQVRKRLGLEEETPVAQRIADFFLDKNTQYEGLLGFLGGSVQTVAAKAVAGQYSGSYRDKLKQRYEEQQAQLSANEEYLKKKMSDAAKIEELIKEAAETGDTDALDLAKRAGFIDLATENFRRGTTESLFRNLRDIMDMKPEEAKAAGYDEDYKQNAQQLLNELQTMEREWNVYHGFFNQGELFANRQGMKIYDSLMKGVERKREKATGDMQSYMNVLIDEYKDNNMSGYDPIGIEKAREALLTGELVNPFEIPSADADITTEQRLTTEAAYNAFEKIAGLFETNQTLAAYKAHHDQLETDRNAIDKRIRGMWKNELEMRSNAMQRYAKLVVAAEGARSEKQLKKAEDIFNSIKNDLSEEMRTEAETQLAEVRKRIEEIENKKRAAKTETNNNKRKAWWQRTRANKDENKKPPVEDVTAEVVESKQNKQTAYRSWVDKVTSTSKEGFADLLSEIEAAKDLNATEKNLLKELINAQASDPTVPNVANDVTDHVVNEQSQSEKIDKIREDANTAIDEAFDALDAYENSSGAPLFDAEVLAKHSALVATAANKIYELLIAEGTIKSKDEMDFRLFAQAFIDRKGKDAVQPIFMRLQRMYNMSRGYDAVVEISWEDFIQGKDMDTGVVVEQDAHSKLEANLDIIDDLVRSLKVYMVREGKVPTRRDDQGNPIYDNRVAKNGRFARIAKLDRPFAISHEENMFKFEEVTDELNKKDFNKHVLDEKQFPPGTRLRFIVRDDYDGMINLNEAEVKILSKRLNIVTDSNGRGQVLWSNYKKEFPAGTPEYMEHVPIQIEGENAELKVFEPIGFVHQTNYISEWNTGIDANEDRDKLNALRSSILRNQNVAANPNINGAIINSRDRGHLFITTQKYTVSEAMPNARLAVARDGHTLLRMKKTPTRRKIFRDPNKPYEPGAVYALIPTVVNGEEGDIAVPLTPAKLGEKAAQSIFNAVRIYLSYKKHYDNNTAMQEIVKEVKMKTGYNIRNIQGLRAYIRLFVNNHRITASNLEESIALNYKDKIEQSFGRTFLAIYSKQDKSTGRFENRSYIEVHNPNPNGDTHTVSVHSGGEGGGSTFHDWMAEYETLTGENGLLRDMYTSVDLTRMGSETETLPITPVYITTIADGEENAGQLRVEESAEDYESYVKANHTTNVKGVNVGTDTEQNWQYFIGHSLDMDVNKMIGLEEAKEETVPEILKQYEPLASVLSKFSTIDDILYSKNALQQITNRLDQLMDSGLSAQQIIDELVSMGRSLGVKIAFLDELRGLVPNRIQKGKRYQTFSINLGIVDGRLIEYNSKTQTGVLETDDGVRVQVKKARLRTLNENTNNPFAKSLKEYISNYHLGKHITNISELAGISKASKIKLVDVEVELMQPILAEIQKFDNALKLISEISNLIQRYGDEAKPAKIAHDVAVTFKLDKSIITQLTQFVRMKQEGELNGTFEAYALSTPMPDAASENAKQKKQVTVAMQKLEEAFFKGDPIKLAQAIENVLLQLAQADFYEGVFLTEDQLQMLEAAQILLSEKGIETVISNGNLGKLNGYHSGMNLLIVNSIPFSETTKLTEDHLNQLEAIIKVHDRQLKHDPNANFPELIFKVRKPEVIKDGKMISSAEIEVVVMSREEAEKLIAERKKKGKAETKPVVKPVTKPEKTIDEVIEEKESEYGILGNFSFTDLQEDVDVDGDEITPAPIVLDEVLEEDSPGEEFLRGYVVEGLTLRQTDDIATSIAGKINRDLIAGIIDEDARINKVLNRVYDNYHTRRNNLKDAINYLEARIAEGKDDIAFGTVARMKKVLAANRAQFEIFEKLLSPTEWPKITNQVKIRLHQLSTINIQYADDSLTNEVVSVNATDNEDLDLSRGDPGPDFFMRVDSKDTASKHIKKFIASIKTGERNLFNDHLFMDFNEAFDTVSEILRNTRADLPDMIDRLRKVAISESTKKPIPGLEWLINLADSLDNNAKTRAEEDILALEKLIDKAENQINAFNKVLASPQDDMQRDFILKLKRDAERDIENHKREIDQLDTQVMKERDDFTKVQAEFQVVMSKDYLGMKQLLYRFNPQTFKTQFMWIDSDSTEQSKAHYKDWENSAKLNMFSPDPTDPTSLVLKDNVRTRIINWFHEYAKMEGGKMVTQKLPQDIDELRVFFNLLGFHNISESTLSDLLNGKFYHLNRQYELEDLFLDPGGLFRIIYSKMGRSAEGIIWDNDRIVDEPVIKKSLAKHDAKYQRNLFSNSFRIAGKTVWNYIATKYLVDRFEAIKRDKDLIKRLLKDPFVQGDSMLLRQLLATIEEGENAGTVDEKNLEFNKDRNTGEEGVGFSEFDYFTTALEPVKKLRSANRKNRELNKISEGEHEFYKMGMLQSIRNIRGRKRIMAVLYPTSSDKTTAMGFKMEGIILDFDEETDKVGYMAINDIYTQSVLPEIRRINAYNERKRQGRKVNIDAYEEGAGLFHLFPSMNNLDQIWETKTDENGNQYRTGELLTDIITNETAKAAIKEEISKVVEAAIDNKVAFWEEVGIVQNETGKDDDWRMMFHQKANDSYISGKDGFNTEANTRKGTIRRAAADMVVNYMIANANIFRVFVGDPAQMWKSSLAATSEEFHRLTPENRIRAVQESFVNVGKRLAADIAPGHRMADEMYSRIRYVMLRDRQGPSSNMQAIRDIISEAVERKFMSQEQADKVIDAYSKIKSTDAQEYTTWKEHLKMLRGYGNITQGQYEKFYSLFEKGDDLTDAEMEEVSTLILQPFKPVYVNNISDDEFDITRRLYVKSSSFPLIPQLTRGTELENLRTMLEDMENMSDPDVTVRAAHATAVKVGNVRKENQITVWDNDTGDIVLKEKYTPEELDAMMQTGTLVVPRNGFKKQQDMPFKEEKKEVNKVSQNSKLLFVNILDAKGFKVNPETISGINKMVEEGDETLSELHELVNKLASQDDITGHELSSMHNAIWHEIFKTAYYQFLNEMSIEVDEQTGSLVLTDVSRKKLLKMIEKEALDRKYPLTVVHSLKTETGLQFLKFSPYADKFESLLNSLINSNIVRHKMPGHSYILGSQEGFKPKSTILEGEAGQTWISNNKSGIIYTSSFDMKKGVQSYRNEDGVIVDQVLVSSRLRGLDGKFINLREKRDGKYIWLDELPDGRVQLKMYDKNNPQAGGIDPQILKMYGMRIPNQGPNSTANIEIVGFLPDNAADLIIAPRDFVARMGSDFDIDKLYSYMYETSVITEDTMTPKELEKYSKEKMKQWKEWASTLNWSPDAQKEIIRKNIENFDPQRSKIQFAAGVLENAVYIEDKDMFVPKDEIKKLPKPIAIVRYNGKNKMKLLKNMVVDVNFSVANNGDVEVQHQIIKALDEWKLSDFVEEIRDLRKGNVNMQFTPLSDDYQRGKYVSGTKGKAGTAVFSLDSVLNAMLQGVKSKVRLREMDKYVTVQVGKVKSDGTLNNKRTLSGNYYISDIITGYQSASVDNEALQLLAEMNVNDETFSFIRIMNQLGFEDETVFMLQQPIVRDFVELAKGLSSPLNSEFIPQSRMAEVVRERLIDKYMPGKDLVAKLDYVNENIKESRLRTDNFLEKMKSYVKDESKVSGFAEDQIAILDFFIKMTEYGDKLQDVQTTINTDTAGVGKTVIESILKEEKLFQMDVHTFENIFGIVGYIRKVNKRREFIPTTISGFSMKYGVMTANRLWASTEDPIFPYRERAFADPKSGLFIEAERVAKKKFTSPSSQADFRKKVYNATKSYVFSMQELGLTLFTGGVDESFRPKIASDINAERRRLFMDEPATTTSALIKRIDAHPDKVKLSQATVVHRPNDTTEPVVRNEGRVSVWHELSNLQVYMYLVQNIQRTDDEPTVDELFEALTQLDAKEYFKTFVGDPKGMSAFLANVYLNATINNRVKPTMEDLEDAIQQLIEAVTNPKGHQSIASVLAGMRESRDPEVRKYMSKNSFLNRLSIYIGDAGRPSTITFNSASGETFEEEMFHIAFLDMIYSKDQPSLGIYNNIEYTPRLLAQELIAAQYLAGGKQEAVEYTKMIPVPFLYSLPGFVDTLMDISNNEFSRISKRFGQTRKKIITVQNYHFISQVVRQFFQHNTGQVPSASPEQIVDAATYTGGTQSLSTMVSFTPKKMDAGNKYLYTEEIKAEGVGTDFVPTPMITLWDKTNKGNKTLLFQWDGTQYVRIDVLSQFPISQYNANLRSPGFDTQTTIVEVNHAPVEFRYGGNDIVHGSPAMNDKEARSRLFSYLKSELDDIGSAGYEYLKDLAEGGHKLAQTILDTREPATTVFDRALQMWAEHEKSMKEHKTPTLAEHELNSIKTFIDKFRDQSLVERLVTFMAENTLDPYIREISRQIKENLESMTSVNDQVVAILPLNKTDGKAIGHLPRRGVIGIHSKFRTAFDQVTVEEIGDHPARMIIHDLFHVPIDLKLRLFEQGKTSKLSAAEVKHMTEIKRAFDEFKEAIRKGQVPDYSWEELQKFESGDKELFEKYYWTQNLSEFASEVMTNRYLQGAMNSIATKRDTFYDRVIKAIMNLLKAMGMTYEPNSLFGLAVENILAMTYTKNYGKADTSRSSGPKVINVWFGTGENAKFSNLAHRPFVSKDYDGTERTYVSVEHFYQSWKSGTFDAETSAQYEGTKGGIKIQSKLKPKTEDGWNIKVMKDAMLKSFESNEFDMNALIRTGTLPFSHTQGDEFWSKQFPILLEEVRAELAAKQKKSSTAQTAPKDANNRYDRDDTTKYFLGKENDGTPIMPKRALHLYPLTNLVSMTGLNPIKDPNHPEIVFPDVMTYFEVLQRKGVITRGQVKRILATPNPLRWFASVQLAQGANQSPTIIENFKTAYRALFTANPDLLEYLKRFAGRQFIFLDKNSIFGTSQNTKLPEGSNLLGVALTELMAEYQNEISPAPLTLRTTNSEVFQHNNKFYRFQFVNGDPVSYVSGSTPEEMTRPKSYSGKRMIERAAYMYEKVFTEGIVSLPSRVTYASVDHIPQLGPSMAAILQTLNENDNC